MSRPPTIAAEIVKKYLKEDNTEPSKSIAIKLYKKYPLVFTSVHSTRLMILYYRGSCGKKNRKFASEKFTRNNNTRSNIIKSYLEKYPDTNSYRLSVAISARYSSLFKDAEHVRQIIRYYRGSHGKSSRKKIKDKRFLKKTKVNDK